MLKLLVKKQLTEIFRAYIYDAKKNRARSKAATVGYIVFFVLLMVWASSAGCSPSCPLPCAGAWPRPA